MWGISILLVPKLVHDSTGRMEGTGTVERRCEPLHSMQGSQDCSFSHLGPSWDVWSCCPCVRKERGLSLYDCQSGTFHQS